MRLGLDSGSVLPRILATTLVVSLGCSNESSIGPGPVVAIHVTPSSLTLDLGLSGQLHGIPLDRDSSALVRKVVTWTTADASVATVDDSGRVSSVAVGATTVTASVEGVTRPVPVTITKPSIQLAPTSLSFSATAAGADPAAQTVAVTSLRGGALNGLAVGTITYGGGGSGWLSASLDRGTAPATLTVQPATAGLAAGNYTATVSLTSPSATGAATLDVTFLVNPGPAIALNPPSLSFGASPGGADPATQTVNVTNGGAATLTGLGIGTILYGPGASGWVSSANLSSTAAPSVLTVGLATGSLNPGTYTATIPVTSATATNTPQNLGVTFTITPIAAIGLSATSRTFNATQGGGNPASQTVTVNNVGGGSLTGLATSITYSTGNGWLSASLSGTTAPATITLQPTTGSLAVGTYTATVHVSSPVASNSPQDIAVSFTVTATPMISLSATSRSFSAAHSGADPASQTVNITNSGGGTLSGLGTTINYNSGAGWLTASLNTTTAPATLTLQPATGALAVGSYSATVDVTSPVAGNSPQTVTVTFTVQTSFANDVQPIFTARCAGCHPSLSPPNLSAGNAYGAIVGVASNCGGRIYIVAGNLGSSYLYEKVNSATPACGSRMPPGGPFLSAAQLATIQQWILDGAPNN